MRRRSGGGSQLAVRPWLCCVIDNVLKSFAVQSAASTKKKRIWLREFPPPPPPPHRLSLSLHLCRLYLFSRSIIMKDSISRTVFFFFLSKQRVLLHIQRRWSHAEQVFWIPLFHLLAAVAAAAVTAHVVIISDFYPLMVSLLLATTTTRTRREDSPLVVDLTLKLLEATNPTTPTCCCSQTTRVVYAVITPFPLPLIIVNFYVCAVGYTL